MSTRRLHRVIGLLAGPLILIAAGTAIALNHPEAWRPQSARTAQGPFGRSLLSFAANPHAPAEMLAGTRDGLFRSVDGGNSWEEAVLSVPAEEVSAIAYDPRRPGHVTLALRRIGVYASQDGGLVWEEVEIPFMPPEGHEIAGLSIRSDGGLALLTSEGVYERPAKGEWRLATAAKPAPEEGARLKQVVYGLHDGRFYDRWGVPITDAASIALIGLTLSGYGLWGRQTARRWSRRRKRLP